jgi:hypothetical protein
LKIALGTILAIVMQFQPSFSNTISINVSHDLTDLSKIDSSLKDPILPTEGTLSKSTCQPAGESKPYTIKKTSLKTLNKRIRNRTDPFYFEDLVVIGNYDVWLENCIPRDLSLGIKGVLANLHFSIISRGKANGKFNFLLVHFTYLIQHLIS